MNVICWNSDIWKWQCVHCPGWRGKVAREATEHAWREHGVIQRVTYIGNRVRVVPAPERPRVEFR